MTTPVPTVLALSGIGVPPYSCRGATQELKPIAAAASLRRTVNGELIDLSAPQFRKYASSIKCQDQQAPAWDGIWPGLIVVVDCISEWSYLTATGGPERTAVEGSSRVEGDYTIYRPQLIMRVTDFDATKDEYGATTSWSIDLEEV